MRETGRGHMPAYRRATLTSTHRAARNMVSGECKENCLMARQIKCVCRCGGANHRAYMRRGNKRLDDFNALITACDGCESVKLPTANESVGFIES